MRKQYIISISTLLFFSLLFLSLFLLLVVAIIIIIAVFLFHFTLFAVKSMVKGINNDKNNNNNNNNNKNITDQFIIRVHTICAERISNVRLFSSASSSQPMLQNFRVFQRDAYSNFYFISIAATHTLLHTHTDRTVRSCDEHNIKV